MSRSYIEREVAARSRHMTAEEVRTTCSFARAERLLGREYHGRFLIELLQNAADAWRNDPRSLDRRSRVAVVIAEGPTLLVANEGAPMTAEVVIESLGHIGASTKSEGEAIGHKGIGFKSVLEITLAPEIYSGLQEREPELAVSFDPGLALDAIIEQSPDWERFIASVQGLDHADRFAAVPILRFPHWIADRPADVTALAADGFDTVVRLPFDQRLSERIGMEEATWLASVREAVNDVSDQILLLLGCFSEVRITDRLASVEEIVRPEYSDGVEPRTTSDGEKPEHIRILRNGLVSSSWRLFRHSLPALEHLTGEIAVGLRLETSDGEAVIVPATDGVVSAPFHLFFPTRIPSGLPFLLHGYFEVDAARTGFYRGSASRNRAIMEELAALSARVVEYAASDPDVNMVSLVDLVAAASDPEDPLARGFRRDVLDRLDSVDWVPLQSNETPRRGRPASVFVAGPTITRHIAKVFTPEYLEARVQLGLPDTRLSDASLELVAARQPEDRADQWTVLGRLCRPGSLALWEKDEADQGFRSLLDLLEALTVESRSAATTLIDGLRGDPDSRLLPASGPAGTRVLLPVPDPTEGVPGRRSQLVMARARITSGDTLVPPPELDLAFLPEGLLGSEAEIDRAKPLGVRPFTVDNVLDRLNGIGQSDADPEALVSFLWQLLARERVSGFGTKRSAERAAVFDPSQWFWCRPGRAREDDTARLRQQRERFLADVRVPCRDGRWRPAGTVAFGADWAEWLESGNAGGADSTAAHQRAAAYRALETISPGPEALLASPSEILKLLTAQPLEARLDEDDPEVEEQPDELKRNSERFAFLLRLGVWEVPPLEAFENRERANRPNFPWSGPIAMLQQELIAQAGGWRFGLDGWAGQRHHNVYVAEDYRFVWSLENAALMDGAALAVAVGNGAKLYGERLNLSVFCPQCKDSGSSHTAGRQSSSMSGYLSSLALQLRRDRWVACSLDGVALEKPVAPAEAWWHQKPPTGAGLRQSPWRLLPLCGPATGMSEELHRLAGTNSLDGASLAVVKSLLQEMRAQYESGSLVVDPTSSGSARQAFVGLHRLAYERLSELAVQASDEVAEVLDATGVLCDLGDGLVYRAVDEARHDDGRFSTYVRHFVGVVPFVALPRDQEVRAARLGIQPFAVHLTRRGDDDGVDVTDQLRGILGDRIPELLAIVVNHSLGTQTLELTSIQFEERARRLQALTVRQTEDLIVDACIDGSAFKVTLGEGTDQDIFLENPTSAAPVLFHDLAGPGWQDRLRRKIAPHLASVLENTAYAHTLALFLQAESAADREEFLLELGISSDEVDAVAARIGVVGEEERQRHLRWYRAVTRVLGSDESDLDLEHDALALALSDCGLPSGMVQALIDGGGGEGVRRDTSEGSSLQLLAGTGLDLSSLDDELRRLGDPGLSISVARKRLARWIDANGRRLAAVLAGSVLPEVAKSMVRAVEPPPRLAFSIDPPAQALLAPVAELLQSAGHAADLGALAIDPVSELIRLGGFGSVEALDDRVQLLFNHEEQQRVLRERAAQWRREIRLLAVLCRLGPAETRATIRAIDEVVGATLPVAPALPSDLVEAVRELFIEHQDLGNLLADRLSDSLAGIGPDRDDLLVAAQVLGVEVGRLPTLLRALEAPRRDHARAVKDRAERMSRAGLAPRQPEGMVAPPAPAGSGTSGRRRVTSVKVGEGHDRQKRELGDEGEQWALAAVVSTLLASSPEDRDRAIDDIVALLSAFHGPPVDAALAHAELARSRQLDDEELIDELTGLLHVSHHSDGFGFDLVGWLPDTPGTPPRAMCLEVKSSGGEGFNLSSAEWALARRFNDENEGSSYAVLVVRRSKRGGVPAGMDLLLDPVALVESGRLRQEVDGYRMAYRVGQRAGEP